MTERQKQMVAYLKTRGMRGIPVEVVTGGDRATLNSLCRRRILFYVCTHTQVMIPGEGKFNFAWIDAGAVNNSFRWVYRGALLAQLGEWPAMIERLGEPDYS